MTKITISCDGILCQNEFELDAPSGWSGRIDLDFGGDSSYLFCSDCAKQGDWFDSQCPGCVCGYPDCGLGESFRYCDNRLSISAENFKSIRAGVCPFRVNGSFSFDSNTRKFESINLSEQAATESGNAVADAIGAYINKYAKGNR